MDGRAVHLLEAVRPRSGSGDTTVLDGWEGTRAARGTVEEGREVVSCVWAVERVVGVGSDGLIYVRPAEGRELDGVVEGFRGLGVGVPILGKVSVLMFSSLLVPNRSNWFARDLRYAQSIPWSKQFPNLPAQTPNLALTCYYAN